ncbi:hypothetical protein K461DRAFT_296288 [Myriangium duriaei CBS 260.36]|uniref:N-acetyltransferase domain-containing protein n=1 Tax=Myriangium duriaei CBS 260.36 TaxID=1168546 RepID=A0A9P4IWP8_9PEZI|nr:hypothetical protein K461DRAFT_296288 [Myriangium duriaei CBS 260.36]
MHVNEHTALVTPKVLLVPYSEHHVPTYHEWMKDEDLQKATASEALTLEEEYEMQRSWRTDADKLTFIIAEPTQSQNGQQISPGEYDRSDRMIGDVNLFLADDDDFVNPEADKDVPRYVVGELELMIARRDQRRHGYGSGALKAFIGYVKENLDKILGEYASGQLASLSYLRVRIGADNAGSIALFEGIGFKKISEKANFFGELELRRNIDSMWDGDEGVRQILYEGKPPS